MEDRVAGIEATLLALFRAKGHTDIDWLDSEFRPTCLN